MRSRPLVVAHRGASTGAVDNSLEAFERAIEVGADMIEFDVRRTQDGQLIAFHDARVRGRPVGALTRADIGLACGHVPPLLDEVLDLTRGRIALDVEVKEDGYVERILRSVRDRFEPQDVVVTSFVDDVVRQVKVLDPELRAGLLVGHHAPRAALRTRLSELYPVRRAKECRADLLAIHHRLADLGALARAHAAGYPVFVWTVNDAARLTRLIDDERVEAIITDEPATLVALLAASGRPLGRAS